MPIAATAIFFLVFSTASFVGYSVSTTLLIAFDSKYIPMGPWAVTLFLGCVFLPVSVLARVQIRTQPTAAPMI